MVIQFWQFCVAHINSSVKLIRSTALLTATLDIEQKNLRCVL